MVRHRWQRLLYQVYYHPHSHTVFAVMGLALERAAGRLAEAAEKADQQVV